MTDVPSTDWAEPRRTCPYGCADYVALLDERAALLARAEKAEAEAKALRGALSPFAIADLPQWATNNLHVLADDAEVPIYPTASDLRRARALTGGDR